jgi:hypothetical protein
MYVAGDLSWALGALETEPLNRVQKKRVVAPEQQFGARSSV